MSTRCKLSYFLPCVTYIICIELCLLLLPAKGLLGAEVETIEGSDIPAELEKAVELKREEDFKIIPVVDITALGTYSKVSGSNDLAGANVRGSLAPVLRLDKKNYLIPLYYGSYNRERQVVVEEEGGRVYNELMDHNVTLEYKHILDETITVKVDGLLRLHYVKEDGYDWSDGLYDYEDLGTAGSLEYFFVKKPRKRASITVGGEFYHRAYPNYQSLISLATVTAPETDEKDYWGYRPTFRAKYMSRGLNCTVFYSPLRKDYDDKKIIGSNGVLTNKRRDDWFHYADIDFSYLFEPSPVVFGLGITGIVVDSDQNYYDSRNTISLTDDVFTSDYYSFKSLKGNPKLTYMYKLKDRKKPATITLGYAYLIREYDNRKAQRVDGVYTDDPEVDQISTLTLQGVYPITDQISAVGTASYTRGRSNMRYETYYSYRYESYFAGGGIRIKY